jgi:uncharacterized protein
VEHRLSSVSGAGERIEIVDALRALALAGILQVNIQSFVWGSGDPLGAFLTVPSATDVAAHLLVGTFVSGKFISIFAFLFGFGAALQFRSIARALPGTLVGPGRVEGAQAVYRRRLWFLLAVGIAHGVLFYYGDILTFYALCGFILVLFLPWRASRLVRATVIWWIAAVVLMIAGTVMLDAGREGTEIDGESTLPLSTMRAFLTYTEGGFFEQVATRLDDYFGVLLSSLSLSIPQIVGLYLLGVLAGRLGWFARPERHATLWQAASWIGLLALPFAAFGEWLNYEAVRNRPGDPAGVGFLLQFFGSALACFYVAALVRLRNTAPVAALIRWMAPAGRMPLTNYLTQSVLMAFLLSGWGLQLGAELNRTELALLALGIVPAQWAVSRWWITRFGKGPMEAWWARATYRKRTVDPPAPPGSGPPSGSAQD